VDRNGKPGARFDADAKAAAPRDIGLIEIFLLFSELGLSSFGGGVSAWMHRAFVERRGWMAEREFAAALALARIMPGANVVNLAILIGQRLRGALGAVAAVAGMLVGPSLVIIAVAIVYRRFAGSDVLGAVLEGAAAAAVGLIIAMGVQSARGIVRPKGDTSRGAVQRVGVISILAATFVCIGVLRLPTVPVVLCLAPLSIALAFFAGRSGATETPDAG
jgi:chromate transporter